MSKSPNQREEEYLCGQHSFSQAKFLLDPLLGGRTIDLNIELTIDIAEIHRLLQMTSLKMTRLQSHPQGLHQTILRELISSIGKRDCPQRKALLRICKFVILDYYHSDFQPTGIFQRQVKSHIVIEERKLG